MGKLKVGDFMNKNLMVGIVVVIVLIGAGWFLLKDRMMPSDTQTQTSEELTVPSDSSLTASSVPGAVVESTGSSAMEGDAKEFTVSASNFKFDMPEIKVKKGDNVKITFKNTQGFHDFVIDEYNVKAKQAQGPSEEALTFVADKVGEFAFYCSVGQHRSMGMEGKLVVE